ncbi:MAG: hypothetical protein L6V93_12485 [Clostridiales bacterium]|nr:MAG: hypothetical protein L6V93_12485 [Clostridiales bacterium]
MKKAITDIATCLTLFRILLKNNTLTKELIDKLISRIDIYKGKQVEITYSFDNEFESEAIANG